MYAVARGAPTPSLGLSVTGIQENFNYDHRARLTSTSAGSAYSLSMGYAPDGDVTSANDSVNGDWTFTYDGFNRLATSNKNSGQLSYTYAYDRYGNMWHGDGGLSVSFSGANNRVDGYSYDASGNLLDDGTHSYTYDAENRITQVDGGSTATYVYDALGHRVRRGTLDYVYDAAGHAVALVYGCQTCWYRGEVFAGSRHLATYANSTTYFAHSDWLGTERARTDVNGAVSETCQGLPYGDGLSCSSDDITPLHFTGKERDGESNLDNFGARYYTSTMGRWMTPDWSARGEAVPYAVLTNPQSLNLYAYVLDNPTTSLDPDGHNNGPGHDETPPNGCGGTNQPACQQSSAQVAADQTNNPPAQRQNEQPRSQPAQPVPAYVPGKLPPAADPAANAAKDATRQILKPRQPRNPEAPDEYPPAQVEPPPTLVPGQNSPAPIGTVPASTPEINTQNLSFGKRLILGIVQGLRTWPGASDFVFAVIPRPLYRPQDPKLCLNGCVM